MDADERPPPAVGEPGEDDLARRYHRAVDRLMADYQRSYDPDAAEEERELTVDGEGLYSGPFYRTWEQAHAAVVYHKAQAEAAHEALPAAEAALQAAVEHRDLLRSELARTHPWRRRKRARLSEQVEQAEQAAENRNFEFSCHEFSKTWSSERYCHALAVADLLRRNERVKRAAGDAAARSLGWRSDQPSTTSRPPAVPLPGRPAPSRRARRADTNTNTAAQLPPLMTPRVQRPPGRAPRK